MIRRVLLILMFGIISALCPAQEWINSLDVAKRLAFIQDKMLLVMWEDSTLDEVLVMLEDKDKQGLFDALNSRGQDPNEYYDDSLISPKPY